MIQIRRSKATLMGLLNQLKEQREDIFFDPSYSLNNLAQYLQEILDVRKKLAISEDFPLEEYKNTLNFVNLLREERYEEIAKLDYKIIEDMQ